MGDITCIFFVPMSTIDDYWLSFGTPTVARGRCARLQPSGGALIGCARNRKRKSFMHMGTDGGGVRNLHQLLRYNFKTSIAHLHKIQIVMMKPNLQFRGTKINSKKNAPA